MKKKFAKSSMISLVDYTGDEMVKLVDREIVAYRRERIIFREVSTDLYFILNFERIPNTSLSYNYTEETVFTDGDIWEVECEEVIPLKKTITEWKKPNE